MKDLYYLLHLVDFLGSTLKLENEFKKFMKHMADVQQSFNLICLFVLTKVVLQRIATKNVDH